MSDPRDTPIRIQITSSKEDAIDIAAAVVKGMKMAAYKFLTGSDPQPSPKNDSEVVLYLEFVDKEV